MRRNDGSARLLAFAALLTGLYCLALAFNLSPWLRGPVDWRWAYARPGTFARLWLPALLLLVYGLIAWRLANRHARRPAIVLAALMTPALQLALLYMDHPDIRAPLFMRTVSPESGGFFTVGAVVSDIPDFLANFATRMPGYPVHPQRHPPGLPLLFAIGRALFDGRPALATTIADPLRPYQCHNLALMNLPSAALATAVLQMAVPFLLGVITWPLARLGRALYDEATAVRAILLWPLLPGVALWATRWNQLYALFAIVALLLFHQALVQNRLTLFFSAGAVVSVATFFSLGNVAIAGFLGVYALVRVWAAGDGRPSWSQLLRSGALFAAGMSLVWLIALPFGVALPAVWQTAMGIHLSIGRSYLDWLFFHLYDFFVFLGLPLAVLWFARLRRPVAGGAGRLDVPLIAFALALGLLNLSGTSQGEVARVWAFLYPLFLITAVARFPADRRAFAAILTLLSLQLFVANIFLRPVGTALSDPPRPPTTVAAPATSPLATWEDGPRLLAATVPIEGAAGEGLIVEATWTAVEQAARPYTFFLHLLDETGQLAAQHDDQPVAGAWPTTCWQPDAPFTDQVRLALPDVPGTYRLQAGYYWLPTLERLPLFDGSDTLSLGEIIVR